jgi:hypothetical protein
VLLTLTLTLTLDGGKTDMNDATFDPLSDHQYDALRAPAWLHETQSVVAGVDANGESLKRPLQPRAVQCYSHARDVASVSLLYREDQSRQSTLEVTEQPIAFAANGVGTGGRGTAEETLACFYEA